MLPRTLPALRLSANAIAITAPARKIPRACAQVWPSEPVRHIHTHIHRRPHPRPQQQYTHHSHSHPHPQHLHQYVHRPQRRNYQYHDPQDPRIRDARPLVTGAGFRAFAGRASTRTVAAVAVLAAFAFYFSHLETVPVTGRTRFKYYSREFVRRTAEMQFRAVLYDIERQGARLLPGWDPRTAQVNRVMKKLIPFSGLQDEEWEVFVIDDAGTSNAFVLPGGKVFVFSGILRLARGDGALAAVLGHEIAHNVADHIGERMSQGIGTNLLLWSLVVLSAAVGIGPLLMQVAGARFLDVVFERPMSRLQESEADYLGLMMMAEACYDPREAVGFWARMQRAQAEEMPEWLSTHPSNESRIRKMQEWMPKALEKRAQSDCSTTTAFADLFRRAMERGVVIGEQTRHSSGLRTLLELRRTRRSTGIGYHGPMSLDLPFFLAWWCSHPLSI